MGFGVTIRGRLASIGLAGLLFGASGCGSDSDTDASGGAGASGGSGGSAGNAGSSGAAGATPCTLAASWELVDDYQNSPGEPSNPSAVTVDSDGNVYAVGLVRQGVNNFVGVVRKSSDGGQTWTDLAWPDGLPGDAAADDAGNVYVIAGNNGRVIRKSADAGASWDDVEVIPMTGGTNEPCNLGFLGTGPNGVVVAGASCDSSGWVVRKSTDSGATWQHAFSFQLAAGKTARMEDVGVDSDGEAYATGQAVDAADATHWVTVRGGAATGIVSDDFQLASGIEAHGRGFSSHGEPLVAGFASDGSTTYGIVRRMTGVDQWQTSFQFPTRASDVEVAGDALIVAGSLDEAAGERLVTRLSNDGGKSWSIIDEYTYVAGKRTGSGTLAADARGNVYNLFGAPDANDVNHWLVRKLACR